MPFLHNVSASSKILLIASPATLEEMLRKGNVWYIRHYETYFDKVYCVYLSGRPHVPVTRGNTTLMSIAGRGPNELNLLLAPFRLYQLAREIKPTSCVTGDLVYSWWTFVLLRLLMNFKVILAPVCIPELIYENTGKSMSGLFPIWFERVCVLRSFQVAAKVVTPSREGGGDFYDWMLAYPSSPEKAVIVDPAVDDLPSIGFYESLRLARRQRLRAGRQKTVLTYVGRLSEDKLVEDLIIMMSKIKGLSEKSSAVRLEMIGDGPQRAFLERRCVELGIRGLVSFVGTVPNVDLPKRLLMSDVFLSPYTGTALREAALCGLPIVAYDTDWVRGVFRHEKTALLVSPRDIDGMAKQSVRLVNDANLRRKLSRNVKELAWNLWYPARLKESLQKEFGEDYGWNNLGHGQS